MQRIGSLSFLILCLCVSASSASTIEVPGDYSAIQQAIDAAINNDVVLVDPGTYVENIDFKGKAITVVSKEGPESTIINGGTPIDPDFGSVVTFKNSEGLDSVLEGFTLTNGSWTYDTFSGVRYGGNVYCLSASPTLKNNIITNPKFELLSSGGGVYSEGGSPLILNNLIYDNACVYGPGGGVCCRGGAPQIIGNEITDNRAASDSGGGIALMNSDALIENNSITINSCEINGGGIFAMNCQPVVKGNEIIGNGGALVIGGGMSCVSGGTFDSNLIQDNYADHGGGFHGSGSIVNNIFWKNYATYSGGGMVVASSEITNNVVWENIASFNEGGGVNCNSGSSIITNTIIRKNSAATAPQIAGNNVVRYSNVEGGWVGEKNIDIPPQFMDAKNGDFHLQYNSPCRDAGESPAPSLPLVDNEGDPRASQLGVDIGADEFHPHLYYRGEQAPGKTLDLRIVGVPHTFPIYLWVGSGVMATPMSTPYGDWHLDLPILVFMTLGNIPVNGIMNLHFTVPLDFEPWDIPIQTVIGGELSNLCVIED